MKFRLLATSVAVTLALSGCASNSQSTMVKEVEIEQQVSQDDNRVFSQDYLLEELENGLRVMVVKTDYPDVVSLQMLVHVMRLKQVKPVLRTSLST